MGTTHSKLKQDNYEWTRNSLEFDGFYVSTGRQRIEEKLESKPSSKRKQRPVQSNDTYGLNHSAPLDENILETDGGSYAHSHQQLNNRRPLSKISIQKSAGGNGKTKREDGNVFDRNTSIEYLKKQVEQKINKAVWTKESDTLRSRTNQCSLESTWGTDEVDNETCIGNYRPEINTGIPQEYESHSGDETNPNKAQGSETVTCDGDNILTNDSPAIEPNGRNDLEEGSLKVENESSNLYPNVTDDVSKTYPTYEELKHEFLRFNSYKSYPNDNNKPYAIRLAQGGFFYTGTGDEVMCYVCSRKKADWRADDDPFEIHVKLNPHCQFLKNNKEVNVPMQSSSVIESRIAQASALVLSHADVADRLDNNNISTNNPSVIPTTTSNTDSEAEQSTAASKNLTSETKSNDGNNRKNNNDDFSGTNRVRSSDAGITDNGKDNTGCRSPQPLISSGPGTQRSTDNTQDRGLVIEQNSNLGNRELSSR